MNAIASTYTKQSNDHNYLMSKIKCSSSPINPVINQEESFKMTNIMSIT
jgi:hypothetical protein